MVLNKETIRNNAKSSSKFANNCSNSLKQILQKCNNNNKVVL